jgi:phospholipase C
MKVSFYFKKFSLKMWVIFVMTVAILVTLVSLNRKTQNAQVETRAQSQATSTVPNFDHIIVVVMENKSYDDIVGNNKAGFINGLIKNGGLASNYSGVAHPSLPNYIALIGGDTFGINSDCTSCFINDKNLVDNFTKAGKTWKAYMQDMPTTCYMGSKGNYAQKHNPFAYFDDIRNNPERCNDKNRPSSKCSRFYLDNT